MPSGVPHAGDLVWIRRLPWRVVSALQQQGVLRVDVTPAGRDRDRRRRTYLSPVDQITPVDARPAWKRVRRQGAVARLAGLVAHQEREDVPASALGASIAIFPHQLEPVLAVLDGARRLLVADAVGLGKTIEAALIVAETCRREPGARVLVLAPASLTAQWVEELHDRVGVQAEIADAATLDHAASEAVHGSNPWERSGVRLTSIDYLKQPHVLAALPAIPWDLVIVDEAHDVTGDSMRWQAAEAVSARSRAIVLLTATPHGGDARRFRRLLDLGRLDGTGKSPTDHLIIFRRTRVGLGLPSERRVRWHGVAMTPAERVATDGLREYERNVLRSAGHARADAARLLASVLRKRALSSMAALARSIDRRLAHIGAEPAGPGWHQPRLFDDADDSLGPAEDAALAADVGMDTSVERAWLRRVKHLVGSAEARDSRQERVAALLRRTGEPVVVFTEFRDTLVAVCRRLEAHHTLAVLHGGQGRAEQERERRRFIDGEARVLVATDVAGQGLNLHTRARWVITIDLPWSPSRLEQRIGRVDRLGQRRSVHATLLIWNAGAGIREDEQHLISRLADKSAAADRALGDDAESAGTLCRKYKKKAELAARAILRQREFAARWRAGEDGGKTIVCGRRVGAGFSRPVRRAEARPYDRTPARNALLVFSVPLVDGSGAVAERHVVGVRAPDTSAETVAAAGAAAARSLAARAARLGRRRRHRLPAAISREHAIARASVTPTPEARVQTGLFDRREARARDASGRREREASVEAEARVDRLAASADVTVGAARLRMVWGR